MTARRASFISSLPLVVALALLASFATTPRSQAATLPARGIYRVYPGVMKDFRPLLRLGLDVAGVGPGGSLDLVLTLAERDQVRALGFDPLPLDLWAGTAPGAAQSPLLNPNLGAYHTYAEAHDEMVAYVAAHPTIALLDTIGTSLEGRVIEAVKISDNVAVQETEPEALVVGCHHARELMSVELPLYLMRRLLDGYGTDPVLTSLVNERQIWIVPIVNPDGYVYVQNNSGGQSDSWWRKNRRVNGDGSIGVDLNRNYSFNWGYDDVGSSPNPSAETYRGTASFSEPEISGLRDFMAVHAFSISASFHSYGALFLYPWGYAPLDTPDNAIFKALGDSVSSQNGYLAGNPKNGAIYLTNGDMDDWAYGDTTTKPRLYGFTFELNTAAQGGFAPADALIGPTCVLNWGPLLTLLRYADAPRRILPPSRPTAPGYNVVSGSLSVSWSYPAPDPVNPPARHDLRRITSVTIGTDDAESGVGAWDSLGFAWSGTRHASGVRSFWSGSGNNRTSLLTAKAGIDAAPGESLVTMAYWDLESNYDYWYLEVSADGGATWTAVPGNWTTNFNPFGANDGNGVTGSSGGVFQRAAFTLGAFAGSQVLVRFRCSTDAANALEGLYLDDVAPLPFQSGITDLDTQSPSNSYVLSPIPNAATWFQVRGDDAEGQAGYWGPRSKFDPSVSGVAEGPPRAPTADRIGQNVPNPFNPETEIEFEIGAGQGGPYRLDIYDASGRHVARLAEGRDVGTGGRRSVWWGGRSDAGVDVGSGIYFVTLETVRGRTSSKISLLR